MDFLRVLVLIHRQVKCQRAVAGGELENQVPYWPGNGAKHGCIWLYYAILIL